jgi:predicted GTPase
MGAAGRDFHNFNTFFKDNPNYLVVAFTAAQISELDSGAGVEKRIYPPELAGEKYPEGIKIFPEERLEALINDLKVDEVFFSYSDVSAEYLHDEVSRVQSAGASFVLLGPNDTMIESKKPLISICASRTGSGKSPTSRWLVRTLKNTGYKVVVIRHPMPYGDLRKQKLQRFETYDDLDKHECTVEEREDYEPHIDMGAVVFAGVDYQEIINAAEKEADIIVWDGGNNDFPFYKPTKHIVIVDPHRVGHELRYYPGETNVRMADIIIISKVNTADPENVKLVKENVKRINPSAKIIESNIIITSEDVEQLPGKRVLIIEDGPTLTHGEMEYGAATLIAKDNEAVIVDPRPYAKGSIRSVYNLWPHLGELLPAVGYSEDQIKELEESINATPCDLVLMGTPTDLRRYLNVHKPVLRVRYEYGEIEPGTLIGLLEDILP